MTDHQPVDPAADNVGDPAVEGVAEGPLPDPALASAVLEIEQHISSAGWDQPARLYALEFAKPEYAERHARETPFKIALARVKPKDKDSGDVERFRLRQVTNRDGRAVALDRLTLRLQTLPRREGYWLDTGMLKTG